MFDSDLTHYLKDRVVDGVHQIYVGIDNKTNIPMLAIPGVQKAQVGAFYYELSDSEYRAAREDIVGWYERIKNKIQQAA